MTTLMLGIGATKSGTTWLHAQLASHPQVHFRSLGELHFFDALERGDFSREIDKHRRQHAALIARTATARDLRPDQAARLQDREAWLRVLESGRVSDYLAYLRDGAGSARVIGEITPAYALLPEDRLAQMSMLSTDVRFVYILRDPLDRLWSHVRMMAGRRNPDGEVTPDHARRILHRTLRGQESEIARRSDYAGALGRLKASVDREQLFVGTFEDVVLGAGFGRLCDFLGIARHSPDPRPAHEGRALAFPPDDRRATLGWLAPQYAAAMDWYGTHPEGWNAPE